MRQLVAKDSAYFEFQHKPKSMWAKLFKAVDAATERVTLAVQLTPCDVNDTGRFAFHEGQWYKLAA